MPKKLSIEHFVNIANNHDGMCLTNYYDNYNQRIKMKCKNGHIWETTAKSLLNNRWCSECHQTTITIEIIKEMANKLGGECLSDFYLGYRKPMKFKCAKGHVWETCAMSIRAGKWCKICRRNLPTIETFKKIAKDKKGKCLSKKYVNRKTKLKFKCFYGHVWTTTAEVVLKNCWCPECKGVKKQTLKMFKKIAKSRGGKCLSESYKNSTKKLEYECFYGHRWEASCSAIKKGGWCPVCNSSISEQLCKYIFETLFKAPFPKRRPFFLGGLELDGYNDELKLAFEYNGRQHYYNIDFFHKSNKDFEQRCLYDSRKKELCKKHNVVLIVIPYTIKNNELNKFIIKKCKKKNINIPNEIFNIDLSEVYSNIKDIEEIKDICYKKGGMCLSDKYNFNKKLWFKCKENHEWETYPNTIKAGSWCKYCAKNFKFSTVYIRRYAKINNGILISKKYKGAYKKYIWFCKCCSNKFECTYAYLSAKKYWCNLCKSKNTKIQIETMKYCKLIIVE